VQLARVQQAGARASVAARALQDERYDYIIVGGGTAGCLPADRLSADESKRVLVLEAGEDNRDYVIKAPVGLTRLFNHPVLNWNIDSTKQKELQEREVRVKDWGGRRERGSSRRWRQRVKIIIMACLVRRMQRLQAAHSC